MTRKGKNNRKNKKKKESQVSTPKISQAAATEQSTYQPEQNDKPSSVWQQTKRLLSESYAVLGVVIFFLTLYFMKDQIFDLFKSKEEIIEDENFITGMFLPEYKLNPSKGIDLYVGTNIESIQYNRLKEGYEFKPNAYKMSDDKSTFNIKIKLINNRLFISKEFKDIQKEEYVGRLNYDHWEFFIPNYLRFKQTDSSFEVKDRGNNIMFSSLLSKDGVLMLQGYSVNDTSYTVISGDNIISFLKSAKEGALAEIKKIKPIAIK